MDELPRKMRIARISLDFGNLPGLLGIPDNMRILAEHTDSMRNCLNIFVESDELGECEAGQIPPEIHVGVRTTLKDGEKWYQTFIQIPDHLKRKAGEP